MTALHSQVIYFSGKNKTTSEAVQLDSVKIINNTRQLDATIIGDSFDLTWFTAVKESNGNGKQNFSVEQIQSESGTNSLTFRVNANRELNMSINIYNIVGRTILSLKQSLPEGNHNIKINEYLLPGFYFASFSDGVTSQTIKILKTDELFSNYSFANRNPQEKKIVLNNDSYTFIGYAKGFRRDTIDTIAEDGKMYEFQLVKLGDFEFNDGQLTISAIDVYMFYNSEDFSPPEYHQDTWYDTIKIDEYYYENINSIWPNEDSVMERYWFTHEADLVGCTSYMFENFDYCCSKIKEFSSNAVTSHAMGIKVSFDSTNQIINNLSIQIYDYFRSRSQGLSIYDYKYAYELKNIPYTFIDNNFLIIGIKKKDISNFMGIITYKKTESYDGYSVHSKLTVELINVLESDDDSMFIRLVLTK